MQSGQTAQREGTGRHAVVIGASFSGLLCARILRKHFERVTILERDPVTDQPESRKGQPQTRHTHVVLEPARRMIQTLFPAVEPALVAAGACRTDACQGVHWYSFGGYRRSTPVGFDSLTVTRPLLELEVRRAVLAVEGITLRDRVRVDGLELDPEGRRVAALRMTRRDGEAVTERIEADFVVDTAGRGSALPKWLQADGFETPETEEVRIDVRYTTRVYRRAGKYLRDPRVMLSAGVPPDDRIAGAMVPVEGERWFLTLGGWHGASAPTDDAGFLQAVRNLPTRDIYDAVADAEPLSPPMTFNYPSSRRHRYDRLRRFPDNLVALGDSVASFNPVYGQGMSAAALQVEVLDAVLGERSDGPPWKRFFARQARVIDDVWGMAVGEDFRFPQTTGPRPPGVGLTNRFAELAHRAAQVDDAVAHGLVNVISMRRPPTTLMRPTILWRVLRAGWGRS